MDVLINGDIYIKNGPDIFHIDEALQDYIHDLEFESSKENAPDFYAETLERFKEFEQAEGDVDYSYTGDFWVSIINNNSIELIYQDPFSDIRKTFSSKQELEKSFTRLVDFLDKAKYIGRYFKRTSPINDGDHHDFGYTKEDNQVFGLYILGNRLLIKENLFGEYVYAFVSPRYLEDGNYTFYGEQDNSYNDKVAIYKAIHHQIVIKNEKMKKM